jgi:glycosyltransferase involved in cell wall biosynthesis
VKLKILSVIPYFFPASAYGGPVPIVYWICRNLVELGHEVTVFTTDACDGKNRLKVVTGEPVDVDGIKTYFFKNVSNSLAYHKRMFFSPGLIPVTKRKVKNFDIIHLHDFYTFHNAVVGNYANKYKIPFVITPHGALDPIRRKQKNFLKEVYIHLWGQRLLRDAKKIIVTAQAEVEQCLLGGINEDKIEVIPNGVTLSEFQSLYSKEETRKKYHFSRSDEVIVYLGQIHRVKGLDLLVKAFSRMMKENPKAKLLIIGPDSGYLPTLKDLIKRKKIPRNKIVFTGLLDGKEKFSLLASGDIFVYPSYSEGFAVAILEAMAAGLPVLITDKCYFPEVAKGKAGLVVHPEEQEIHEALLELLSDSQLRKKMGANSKKLIQQKFVWPKIVKRLEKIYYQVV